MAVERIWPLNVAQSTHTGATNTADHDDGYTLSNIIDGNAESTGRYAYYYRSGGLSSYQCVLGIGGIATGNTETAWVPRQNTWTDATLRLVVQDVAPVGAWNYYAYVYNGSTLVHTLYTTSSTTKRTFNQALDTTDWGGAGFPQLENLRVLLTASFGDSGGVKVFDCYLEGDIGSSGTQVEVVTPIDAPTATFVDTWTVSGGSAAGKHFIPRVGSVDGYAGKYTPLCADIDSDPSVTVPTLSSGNWNGLVTTETITSLQASVCYTVYGRVNDEIRIEVINDSGTVVATFLNLAGGDPNPADLSEIFSVVSLPGTAHNVFRLQVSGSNKQGDDPVGVRIKGFCVFAKYAVSGATAKAGAVEMAGQGAMTAAGSALTVTQHGAVSMDGQGAMVATGGIYPAVRDAAVEMVGQGQMQAMGSVPVAGAVSMPGMGGMIIGNIGYSVHQRNDLRNLRYIMTVTGSGDGLPDLDLSTKTIVVNARNGSPSFMRVDIPGTRALYDSIKARPNGLLKLGVMATDAEGYDVGFADVVTVNLGDVKFDKHTDSGLVMVRGTKQRTKTIRGKYHVHSPIDQERNGAEIMLVTAFDPRIHIDQNFVYNDVTYAMSEINFLITEKNGITTLRGKAA